MNTVNDIINILNVVIAVILIIIAIIIITVFISCFTNPQQFIVYSIAVIKAFVVTAYQAVVATLWFFVKFAIFSTFIKTLISIITIGIFFLIIFNIGILSVIMNNVTQSIISLGNSYVLLINTTQEEILVPTAPSLNTFHIIIEEIVIGVYDWIEESGIINTLKGWFIWNINLLLYYLDTLTVYIEVAILSITDIIDYVMYLEGRTFEYFKKVSVSQTTIMYEYRIGGFKRRDPTNFLESGITNDWVSSKYQRRGGIKIPVSIIVNNWITTKTIRIEIPSDVIQDLQNRRSLKNEMDIKKELQDITWDDNTEERNVLIFEYLVQQNYWTILRIFILIIQDALDFVVGFILGNLFLLVQFIISLVALFIPYLVMALSLVSNAIIKLIVAIVFYFRGYRVGKDILHEVTNGTEPTRIQEYDNNFADRVVAIFLDKIDPIEILLPANETEVGYSSPGTLEFRLWLVSLLIWIREFLNEIFLNLPILRIFIDKAWCTFLFPLDCAADMEACRILFRDVILLEVIDVWLELIFMINMEGICETLLYAPNTRCICSACPTYGIGFDSILPIKLRYFIERVPCTAGISDSLCCVIDGYTNYDDYCHALSGTGYTSLEPLLSFVDLTKFAIDQPIPSRCTPYGSMIEVYRRLSTFGIDSILPWTSTYYLVKDFHLNELRIARARFPITTESDYLWYPDLGFNLNPNIIPLRTNLEGKVAGTGFPLLCTNMEYDGLLFYSDITALLSPSTGCALFVMSLLSNCYMNYRGRYPSGFKVDYLKDAQRTVFLYQNFICPNGYKVARLFEAKTPQETFRKNYMCIIGEAWINEVRNKYLQLNILDAISSSYPYWKSEDVSPYAYYTSPLIHLSNPEMLLDFQGQEELFCKLNGWYHDCVNAMKINITYTPLGDYTMYQRLFSFSMTPEFPNEYTAPYGSNLFKNRWYKYFTHNPDILYNSYEWMKMVYSKYIYYSRSIHEQFFKNWILYLAWKSAVSTLFGGNADNVQTYYDLMSGDPRDTPIDEIVVHYLNSIDKGYYPWISEDKGNWGCEPVAGENSPFFNYEDILTQYFMAVDSFMHNYITVGKIWENWFADVLVPFIPENTPGYFCEYYKASVGGIRWDCAVTQFYGSSYPYENWWIITDKPYIYYAKYGNLFWAYSGVNFLKLFINDLKNDYNYRGEPGELLDTAIVINNLLGEEGASSYERSFRREAISNILQNLKAYIESPFTNGFSAIVTSYYVYSERDIQTAIDICTTSQLTENICYQIGYGMKNSTEFRECILNPYENEIEDCVELWFQIFYPFGQGGKIKSRVRSFDYGLKR